ncbi:MAG: nucleotidyltransferase domain-containing protein, partial [Candidatus Njordarchaeota archaeon]
YGSRVRGFTHEHSDVDLLIRIDGDVDILDFVLSFISELAIFLNWLWRSK